jgi:cell division protein FtsZ
VTAASAEPAVAVPVQSGGDGASSSGYVPSPVSFVSPDADDGEEEYSGSGTSYGSWDRDRHTEASSAPSASGTSSWKDSGRAGKQDAVFDVTAGRRRPVVFEEDDDLDVPDFLK